jgi:hypothetical protein
VVHDIAVRSALLDVQVAIQEVRRLQQYGVTPGELERYRAALLRDNAQAAEQAESIPSHDNLDFVMESLALGHTVVDHRKVCPDSCCLFRGSKGSLLLQQIFVDVATCASIIPKLSLSWSSLS